MTTVAVNKDKEKIRRRAIKAVCVVMHLRMSIDCKPKGKPRSKVLPFDRATERRLKWLQP